MSDLAAGAVALIAVVAASFIVCAAIVIRAAKRADDQTAEREREALARIHGRLRSDRHPAGKHRR